MVSLSLPPFPSPASELEEFLLSPENLPIHNFRNQQSFWKRTTKPESLLSTSLCPTPTSIAVRRDPVSGELLGYEEVEIKGVGLTPKNSTSLQRAPGCPDQSVEGDSSHFPFWPGGMKVPDTVREIIKGKEDYDLDFENGLLSVPPGFKEGMTFGEAEKKPAVDVAHLTESLQGLLSKYKEKIGLTFDMGEREPDSKENDAKTESLDSSSDDPLDKLVQDQSEHYNESGTEPSVNPKEGWAVKVNLSESTDDFDERIPNMAHSYPFELDSFQKLAILRLESHDCVFVAAHTSAGKTVVAEYAVALSLSHMTKTIYTSPIKALSNQKFRDFRQTFGEDNIGLVTGDIQIKKEAPCLIMTTEILRSMLYHGSDIIRDVEWVIFDEVHYINDSERGVVWEEVMIMLPEHVKLILLSATVPNAMEFADWVGYTKQRKIYVISTTKRPVPLQHYLYTGNSKQTQDQLFMIVDENRHFLTKGYLAAMEAKKEREKQSQAKSGPKGKTYSGSASSQSKNIWLSLVYMLQKKDKLPLIAFTLSRKRCDEYADMLMSLDLTNGQEKHRIHNFFQKSVSILKGSDRDLPQVKWMRELLKRGIAVHHSGILPIIKEIVEMLFGQGMVKLLFATETFAMGVNMPARTVAFDSTEKHDGTKQRDLLPGEYVQMAGRAGRRGKDTTGTVIILCKGEVPESGALNKMILGTPTVLESKFRLTYTMLLNIMRVQTLRVEDVIKRSFAELDSVKHEVDRKEMLKQLLEEKKAMESLNCYHCYEDLDQYYQSCVQIMKLRKKLQALEQPHLMKVLTPGRVIVIHTQKYQYSLAIILQEGPRHSKHASYKSLILCESGDDTELAAKALLCSNTDGVLPHLAMNKLYQPVGEKQHVLLDVPIKMIMGALQNPVSIEPRRILSDFNQRQIPRFMKNPPAPETLKAVDTLYKLSDSPLRSLRLLDPVKDLKMSDIDYVTTKEEFTVVEQTMNCYTCVTCPKFSEHFDYARKKASISDQLSQLSHMLSEDSLQLLPEYQQKVEVLKHFGYIDQEGAIQLKGRVACEIHTHEMMVTELLFRNCLEGFEPTEVAALLSCMVFQQKKCQEPVLTNRLSKGKEMIIEIATEIADLERSFGIDTSPQSYQEEFRFGLMQVVYEWAKGEEFVNITELTDVLEGVIVKCIQRLDELCRDIGKAAKVVGDPRLGQLMRDVSTLIRRDIVFAASLYTI